MARTAQLRSSGALKVLRRTHEKIHRLFPFLQRVSPEQHSSWSTWTSDHAETQSTFHHHLLHSKSCMFDLGFISLTTEDRIELHSSVFLARVLPWGQLHHHTPGLHRSRFISQTAEISFIIRKTELKWKDEKAKINRTRPASCHRDLRTKRACSSIHEHQGFHCGIHRLPARDMRERKNHLS